MAVTSSQIERGSRERIGQSRYRASWKVTTDDKNDGPSTVLVGSRSALPNPVPFPGTVYQIGNDLEFGSYAKSPTIQLRNRGQLETEWRVTVEWGPANEKEETNPLFEPAKYRLDAVTYTEPADVDRDGNPIANSAGLPFEEKATQTVIHPVIVARKNFASFLQIVSLNATYGGKTNSDVYFGQGADYWLCHAITSSEQQSANGVEFYTGYFRIEFNPKKWKEVFVNRGFAHYKSVSDQTLITATDDGVPLGEPVNLKTDGTRESDTATANNLEFFIPEQAAFFGLPV